MSQRITIDPVTRIEGHAKITIMMNDQGEVADARFHVTEFRGFERFCEGRPMWEMPGITARICGICPVSHLLASAKTGDAILAVRIPPAALKLRRLMNAGQLTQSHALSFFHLSAPDLLLGMESEVPSRNVFGLMAANPDLARAGIRLRAYGQEVIARLGGDRVHPDWAVPGGVRNPLTEENRQYLMDGLPEAMSTAVTAIELFKSLLPTFERETAAYGNFPSLYMGLVGKDGQWEHHEGTIRFMDSAGNVIADGIKAADYQQHVGEAAEPWSYMKFPYYKPYGYPGGMYRVGPLARLNICNFIGTPRADAELREFRDRSNGVVSSTFLYHQARLIEIIACLEQIGTLLDDPDVLSPRCRAEADVNQLEAVGASEAPRGTLLHHYEVDRYGTIRRANLIISTGHNNLAMNRTVAQIAKSYISGNTIPEGLLNRVEHGIRCFDPCLSCATHAAGSMPMQVTLVASDGTVLDEVTRS